MKLGATIKFHVTFFSAFLSFQKSFVQSAYFLSRIQNVTVPVGRDAALSCSVAELGNHSVGWIHLKRQMIVAVHSRMITRISRYSVTHDAQNTWTLNIRGVEEEDTGYYMCQINTDPAISQVGYLQVVVPPMIIDAFSSASEIQVREKKNVTLHCEARGFPKPVIKWKREDRKKIYLKNKQRPKLVHKSEYLYLGQVSRTDMGPYLCIASNNVPPSVSKRIVLKIKFSPQVHVPNQLIGVPYDSNVTIECRVEAYPKAITYWVQNSNMLINSEKHVISVEYHSDYELTMRLNIINFKSAKRNRVRCVAKNSLGESEGDIRLNEIKLPASFHSTFSPKHFINEGKNNEKILNKIYSNGKNESGKINGSVRIGIIPKPNYPEMKDFTDDVSKSDKALGGSIAFLFLSVIIVIGSVDGGM